MKVIITGAGGFVGTELTKRMVKSNVEVIAVSRHFGERFPQSKMITRVETEIENTEALIQTIPKSDYEAFYHLAWTGVNGAQKADLLLQIDNVKMTVCCATAAKQLGCKKFLCAGTVAEWAIESLPNLERTNDSMMYSAAKYTTHLLLEAYCKKIDQDYIWMQFSNIYGPQNKTGNLVSYTLGEILNGKEATYGPARQPYDFIFVDDLIEAAFRLGFYETKKNHYVLGSGEPRVLKDYLLEIGRACGKMELIKIGDRPDDGIVYTMDMFDNSELVHDIGNYVTTSFSEGVRYTIDNYRR